jgi:GT2 family glycosyltransferase
LSGLPRIGVTIVTWNSARFLPTCLDALAAQDEPPVEVVVVDNGSTDASAELADRHGVVTRVDRTGANLGFAAGQNRAIEQTQTEWVLVLNPDTRLSPGFLAALGQRAGEHARVGTLCGKLLRLGEDLEPLVPARIDSAGMEIFRSFRHLDRGSGALDTGRFETTETVFGATGAAALYRRSMIADISHDGAFFDPDFFAYREDADLAWRAQILGWDCLYVPEAVGFHLRQIVPESRSGVSAVLNRHSVKNRFLMRWKNADAATWRHCGWRGVGRDLLVLGGCLAREWSSLPGIADALRGLPAGRRQHAWIEQHRRRPTQDVLRWFR